MIQHNQRQRKSVQSLFEKSLAKFAVMSPMIMNILEVLLVMPVKPFFADMLRPTNLNIARFWAFVRLT